MQYKYTRHGLDGRSTGYDIFGSVGDLNSDAVVKSLVTYVDRHGLTPTGPEVFVVRAIDSSGSDTRVIVLGPPERGPQVGELTVG